MSPSIDRVAVFATKQAFLQRSHAVQVQHGTTLEKKMLHKFRIQDKQPYHITGGSIQSHLLRPRGRTFFYETEKLESLQDILDGYSRKVKKTQGNELTEAEVYDSKRNSFFSLQRLMTVHWLPFE